MSGFDLRGFKTANALRGKDVVTLLAREFPKFSKACETAASYPGEYGVMLVPRAAEVLTGKFPKKRKAAKRELLQIRCRVPDELNERFKHQLQRKGVTAQTVLTELVITWIEAFEAEEKAAVREIETRTAAKDMKAFNDNIAKEAAYVKAIQAPLR